MITNESDPAEQRPSSRGSVLILDDEPLVAEALATMVECEGRTVVICNDTASAELALKEFPFTHVISDLQLSDSMPFEGVRFVDIVRRAQPGSRIVVVSGFASYIVKSAALANGADAFLAKPFDRDDIETAMNQGSDHRIDAAADAGRTVHVESLDALLSPQSLTAHFQPIVDLRDTDLPVYGFEALARVANGWPFSDMKTLFDYAARKHRLVELNTVCIRRALTASTVLPQDVRLFLNVDPSAISNGGMPDAIRSAARSAGVPLERIVIELTEDVIVYDDAAAFANVEALRRDGVAFAIDDAESALANIQFIERIKPAYMKLSHHLGCSFHKDDRRQAVVSNMLELGRALGSTVVLEGIDSPETLAAARRLGIQLGQGFWIGRPMPAGDASRFEPPPVSSDVETPSASRRRKSDARAPLQEATA